MRVNSENFGKLWKLYIDNLKDVSKYWDNNEEWTNNVLYNTKLKELILKTFNGLKPEFEYRKIDAVIFAKETFRDIKYYDNSGTIEDTEIPVGIEVVIEHENDYRKAFEEIRKIIELRSKLKVLITYPKDDNKSEIALIEKFNKGVKQALDFLPESKNTEYLLITGFKENKNIRWNFFKATNSNDWTFQKIIIK